MLLYATLRAAAPAAAACAAEPRVDWYNRLPGPDRANKKVRDCDSLSDFRNLRALLLDLRPLLPHQRLLPKETATT